MTNTILRATVRAAILGAGLVLPGAAMAALTDIAQEPVTQVSTNPVKPNVMFILDDSGSMGWTHMPDDVDDAGSTVVFKYGFYGLRSSQCNRVYYNPALTYTPPLKSDGTSFPNATFTAAWTNGFSATGSVNLSSQFRALDRDSDAAGGFLGTRVDTADAAAYYYKYTGTQTTATQQNYNDSTTTFFKECASAFNTAPGNAVFTKVVVSATSGPGSTDERQNFANWYSYYRSRILTMKSAVGVAFNKLDDRYRVGFTTINYTGTDTTNAEFLNISDFTQPQKDSWFTKLYGITPGSGTPLRAALSKVGRIYAGKIGTDPVQYSCQQNFAFLSTDGFWNNDAGYKMDGSSAVGNQDGGGTPRPYYDGQQNTQTTVTTTILKEYSTFSGGCSGGRRKVRETVTQTVRTVKIDTNTGATISDNNPGVVTVTTNTFDNTCRTTPIVPPSSTTGPTSTVSNSATGGSSDSLSDVAMYYYKEDLRTGSAAACATGATLPDGTKADVCKNNVNAAGKDNATWQHMTTFTLGLGVNGALTYSDTYETDTSGDYKAIVDGTKNWPAPGLSGGEGLMTNVDDTWHAAVNGRGTYFNAKNPQAVSDALAKFFQSIQTKLAAGAAAATSNLEPVAGDNFAYVANYRTVKWDGNVNARTINLMTGEIEADVTWSARDVLATRVTASTDSRKIYKFKTGSTSGLEDFLPANFSAAQKTAWFNPLNLSHYATLTAAQKANVTSDRLIAYLRGQKGYEISAANAADNQIFREREYVLGDIVNGKPVYVRVPPFLYSDSGYAAFKGSNAVKNRAGVVYIAANDGMLHAFDSASGQENWAIVPTAVLPNIAKLANADYATNHRFLVDGSPVVGDVADGSGNWTTLLVTGLGAGGRSFIALDVTDPATPKGLWEFTDDNLGLSFGNPIITKLQNGTWVVILSSGYNNVLPGDGKGRIFILDALKGTVIRTIATTAGDVATPSGLGKLTAWVEDGLRSNVSDRLYAGDLQGNVWRFDINDVLGAAGYEAFQLATLNNGTTPQPITTRLEVGEFDSKPIIFAGTGLLLGKLDALNVTQQSLYAIYDKLDTTGVGNPRTNATCPFVQQTITSLSNVERTVSQNTVSYGAQCGWYIDFNPGAASPGERINVDMLLQLGVLSVVTNVPEASACTAGGTSWIYFLNAATGGRIDNVTGQSLGNSLAVGQVVYRLPDGKVVSTITTADDKQLTRATPEPPGGASGGGKRVYWRELFSR